VRSFVKFAGPVPAPLQDNTIYEAAITTKASAKWLHAGCLPVLGGALAQDHLNQRTRCVGRILPDQVFRRTIEAALRTVGKGMLTLRQLPTLAFLLGHAQMSTKRPRIISDGSNLRDARLVMSRR
jgi:hypothetical protein